MPIALVIAVAASLAVHGLLLFIPELELATFSEPPPLLAELQPPPAKAAPVLSPAKPAPAVVRHRPAQRKERAAAPRAPTPVLRVPSPPQVPANAVAEAAIAPTAEQAAQPAPGTIDKLALATPSAPALEAALPSRLPARGTIRYRVDRGDQGFEIGRSTHDWVVVDGDYRITAVTETSGLVALFKPLRIELESRGKLTADGLVPEHFSTRREGRATGEHAEFDWAEMRVQVGKRPPQALSPGAQDLLSFHYQLGLLANLASGIVLPVATGKKYEQFQFEVVGDEDVLTPAGSFRSLHLRVVGVSPTELWLAYDHALLPVKVLHTDHQGAVFVEIATAIELSHEP